ncbi:odorant receptor 4-like isoform X2 [Nylanderia fulva]|nr:odorant receptor 4-like isoform X2 [Nylanderia fulva]
MVDLTRASSIITWNKWFLTFLGLWPLKVNQPIFIFFCVYMIIYCIMGLNHLIKNFSQPELVVANLTDNILLTMILGKMFICRRSCKIMAKFLKAIESDFLTEKYSNIQEKMAYLYYNNIALIFIKISLSLNAVAATLYYFKTFFDNWSAIMSGNFSYDLPYPVHPFFEIKDMSTYMCVCTYLLLNLPLITCGYGGPDAFVLTMALHICGQLAVLSYKINYLLKDRESYHSHVTSIVLRHYHLITLAEILENNFNMLFLEQTLGTVFLLCLTLYNMITNSESDDTVNGINYKVIAFMLYICCVLSTILAYCYIGECLIKESTGLRDALYNSNWYNNSPSHTKLLSICMTRSEKPLVLTAGKFCVLSLNTFTS